MDPSPPLLEGSPTTASLHHRHHHHGSIRRDSGGSAKLDSVLLMADPHSSQREQQLQTSVGAPTPATPTTGFTPTAGKTPVTAEEIQKVHDLINQCLDLYMSETEVVMALNVQANIEPNFTRLVWQKMEHFNPDFFKAYRLRLRVKEQITAFNYIVSQQAQMLYRPQSQPQPILTPTSFLQDNDPSSSTTLSSSIRTGFDEMQVPHIEISSFTEEVSTFTTSHGSISSSSNCFFVEGQNIDLPSSADPSTQLGAASQGATKKRKVSLALSSEAIREIQHSPIIGASTCAISTSTTTTAMANELRRSLLGSLLPSSPLPSLPTSLTNSIEGAASLLPCLSTSSDAVFNFNSLSQPFSPEHAGLRVSREGDNVALGGEHHNLDISQFFFNG